MVTRYRRAWPEPSFPDQDIQCSLDKQGESGEQDATPLEQFTWSYDSIQWTFTPKGGGTSVTRCFNVNPSTTSCSS